MTRTEAESVIKNYKEIDDETGKEYGYTIVEYLDTDMYGHHLFALKADGGNDVVEFAVIDDTLILPLPT